MYNADSPTDPTNTTEILKFKAEVLKNLREYIDESVHEETEMSVRDFGLYLYSLP